MKVRLTQIDGKLPNLALMKLAHWHRAGGDEVHFTRRIADDDLIEWEPQQWGKVYGSAIFASSAARVARFRKNFPSAIVGGTWNTADNRTVEELIEAQEYEHYDYSICDREKFMISHGIGRPREVRIGFSASIGFTQRGCRLKCGFCVVPKKEGRPRSVNTIADIWRGDPHPRHLHLLDNDFFGQPREQWQARVREIIDGKFRVCLNQGINIRMVDEEAAEAIHAMGYWDDNFVRRRLYTAWDNIGDEERFFRGVDTLERAGIKPSHLLVYMLIGYDKRETWERLFYRWKRMADRRILAYPMVYGERGRTLPAGTLQPTMVRNFPVIENPGDTRLQARTLGQFQRYVVARYYTAKDPITKEPTPFERFDRVEWLRGKAARAHEASDQYEMAW
jgi:hypothetical protein